MTPVCAVARSGGAGIGVHNRPQGRAYDRRVGESRGRIVTGLIRVAPHRGDHRVAFRVAVSLAVPLLMLWATGRLDLAVYASFGAFASLYGRFDAYADRIRMQAAAGATMLLAMALGTALSLLSTPTMLRVVAVALAAGVVTFVAAVARWHPPGALFAVFAAGACASLPAGPASFAAVGLVGGGAVVFSLVLTATIAALRRGLRAHAAATSGSAVRRADAVSSAVTVVVGAALAGLAGLLLVGDHWYWAMVAAVAALGGAQLSARVIRGLQRLGGTLVGILLAAALLALGLHPLLTILVAVLLQIGAELYVGRNYGIAMVFVTPLALLMVELAVPADPAVLLRDRVLDTVIGVAVGTAVAVVSATLQTRRVQTRRAH